MPTAPLRFFDGHLDLAYLAENGRDLSRPETECGGPHLPAAVTFPALRAGGVRACLATIFTEPGGTDAVGYPRADSQAAHARGRAQLARYQAWMHAGLLAPLIAPPGPDRTPAPIRGQHGREGGLHPDAGPTRPASPLGPGPAHGGHESDTHAILCGLLMEGADPIRTPAELEWWVEQGVVAIGPAWARGSRYASGNEQPGALGQSDNALQPDGLTSAGQNLIRAAEALGVVIDISHLSDRAADAVLALTDRPVIATHSNCRSLLVRSGGDVRSQRHLPDATIREIARRDGIIGLNLFSPFLRGNLGERGRARLADAVAHLDHICNLAGHCRTVALGSDMDGGFSALRLPLEMSSARDLPRLADTLSDRGWSDADIHAFAWGNWARFWRLTGAGRP